MTAGALIRGAHDASLGGMAVALAKMAIASGCGASADLPVSVAAWFGERAGRVIASVAPDDAATLHDLARRTGVPVRRVGQAGGEALRIGDAGVSVADLRAAWETAF